MEVVIAGGHGQVARRLVRLLAEAGDTARALIRNPAHAADVEADGGVPVVCDLEREDPAPHLQGADAIVFAAGAGPGSGPERKRTVDLGAAVKLIDAAKATGVRRYVIVSSIGAHNPAGGPSAMRAYLEAKGEADAAVAASGLDWTIVRPGSLTDEPGTGRVEITTDMDRRGPVPRDDVALVLAEVLAAAEAVGQTFVLLGGDTPAREAVRALGNQPPAKDVQQA
jgi:uncharacterized protein YbjT (DUF2867 family)